MATTNKNSKKDTKDKYSTVTDDDFSGTQTKEYAGNRQAEATINNPGSVNRLRGLKSDANAKTTGARSDNRL